MGIERVAMQQEDENTFAASRVRYIQDQWIPSHQPDRRWFASRSRFRNGCGRRRELQPAGEGDEYGIGHGDNIPDISGGTADSNKRDSLLRRKSNQLPILREFKHASDFQLAEEEGKESVKVSPLCQRLNTFQNFDDENRWNTLCSQYTNGKDEADNSMIDSMVQFVASTMAREECEAIGNPKSSTNGTWIDMMNMSNELVTFDCYHEPDSEEDEGKING